MSINNTLNSIMMHSSISSPFCTFLLFVWLLTVYHIQEVCFLLYLLGPDNHIPIPIVKIDHVLL